MKPHYFDRVCGDCMFSTLHTKPICDREMWKECRAHPIETDDCYDFLSVEISRRACYRWRLNVIPWKQCCETCRFYTASGNCLAIFPKPFTGGGVLSCPYWELSAKVNVDDMRINDDEED